jgi:large subunit ribosomal protein L35
MSKPIYRYLAQKKWAKYQKLLIEQRIDQFNIVPDLLPHFQPTADVSLAFGRRSVAPGEYVDSRVSELPAKLKVQVFDKGERLVTIAVVDTDVPVPEEDWYTSRAHYLACNIPLSPTQTSIPLSFAKPESQLVHSWLPPFAQKGTPYHRYSIFVLEQPAGVTLDPATLIAHAKNKRDGFHLHGFVDRYGLKPIGLGLFRAKWDEGTFGVMTRHNIEGRDVEYKRKKIEALKPKQKARGWIAKHSSTKYRALWRSKDGIW